MTIHDNRKDQAVASITECLDVVACLIKKKPDGTIIGYPAAILLFCVTDAIAHGLSYGSGHTRLEVLRHPHFGIDISNRKLTRLTQWYRNPLLHNASIVPDAYLTPEDEGCPFDITAERVVIRVPQFYKIVRKAWERVDKGTFDPVKDALAISGFLRPPPLRDLRTLFGTPAEAAVASGNVSLPSTLTPPPSGSFTVPVAPPPSVHTGKKGKLRDRPIR